MSRGSVESSQPRPRTGAKTLRRSRNRMGRNGGDDDIVFIDDVDNEGFDGVVIIDVPESLPKKHRSSRLSIKNKNGSLATVICLDDDENFDSNNAQTGMQVDGNLNNGASTSKNSRHASGQVGRSSHAVADDYEFIYVSPVKLAKGKRTYSGKGTSDRDYIDCDLVVDSLSVREQWEKAFWRRKNDTRNGQSGTGHPESKGHENVNASVHDQHEEYIFMGNDNETEPATAHPIRKEKYGASYNTVDDRKGYTPHDQHEEYIFMGNDNESEPATAHPIRKEKYCASYNTVDDRKGDPPHYQHEEYIFMKRNDNEAEPATAHPTRKEKYVDDRKGDTPHDQHEEYIFMKRNDNETEPATAHPIRKEKYGASYNTADERKGDPQYANEGPPESDSNSRMSLGDQLDDEDDSEGSIMGEREKLKETDEYKKALEEELASRQQALRAQAEEAQNMRRLLKREKAETMRLLDMERRQKQRIEEIRETQKKDVEDMNLKEVIRVSVRKELNQLEKSCYSMASLLQGLGVLDAGPIPPASQVRLAYKKALLTFHPDRASRSDIRQQVEAEEKFKLIARMKEKFLLPV